MSSTTDKALPWIARVFGVAVALFIGVFALDAIGEGTIAFLFHLAPSILLLLAAALAWRWEWIGAAVFTGLGLAYGATAPRWDWVLVIAGPLVLAGLLYLWSWMCGSAAGSGSHDSDRRSDQLVRSGGP
jgi:hypothetical protein